MEVIQSSGSKAWESLFWPHYSPEDLITGGIFRGNYFDDPLREFLPKEWFEGERKIYKFGVSASNSLQWWQERGLMHPDDPRGWIEWYCKYFLGRRHADDRRQIYRWANFCLRHGSMMRYHLEKHEIPIEDESAYPKFRQGLFHWAWDSKIDTRTIFQAVDE
jgi:hypothetical protein